MVPTRGRKDAKKTRSSHHRKTNLSEESKRFSTVRAPRVTGANELSDVMAKKSAMTFTYQQQRQQRQAQSDERRPTPTGGDVSSSATAARRSVQLKDSTGLAATVNRAAAAAAVMTTTTAGYPSEVANAPQVVFDPIPNDAMFYIPATSRFWPPPKMTDAEFAAAGLEQYDRSGSDTVSNARLMLSGAKQQAAGRLLPGRQAGELRKKIRKDGSVAGSGRITFDDD